MYIARGGSVDLLVFHTQLYTPDLALLLIPEKEHNYTPSHLTTLSTDVLHLTD